MKSRAPILGIATAAALHLACNSVQAQGVQAHDQRARVGSETARDLPGDASKYYGQRRNQYRDVGRRLAKVDLDGDFNYDGVIDNHDPADNGAFQQTPPGLVLGTGELTQLILRIRPYHLDFKGRAVVSLQVDGINRGDKSGEFASPEEGRASVGHVRVWRDASRQQLILDSRDPERQVFEWAIDDSRFPANVPGIVPRTLFLEGVDESGDYSGDVRLLLKIQHRSKGATTNHTTDGAKSSKGVIYDDGGPGSIDDGGGSESIYDISGLEGSEGGAKSTKGVIYDEGPTPILKKKSKKVIFKRFSTSYDHILITVQDVPHRKEFVNGNTAGVWAGR